MIRRYSTLLRSKSTPQPHGADIQRYLWYRKDPLDGRVNAERGQWVNALVNPFARLLSDVLPDYRLPLSVPKIHVVLLRRCCPIECKLIWPVRWCRPLKLKLGGVGQIQDTLMAAAFCWWAMVHRDATRGVVNNESGAARSLASASQFYIEPNCSVTLKSLKKSVCALFTWSAQRIPVAYLPCGVLTRKLHVVCVIHRLPFERSVGPVPFRLGFVPVGTAWWMCVEIGLRGGGPVKRLLW